MAEVMTPDHPRWDEFADALYAAINAQEEPGVSDCRHDLSSSRKLLAEMGMDVETSIAFLERNGGHCDCEILLNIDPYENEEGDEDLESLFD